MSYHSIALEDVIAEREKQIVKHGFTIERDREDIAFGRSDVAVLHAMVAGQIEIDWQTFESIWPWTWDISHWKPETDARANLVKAAALILAEIDALDAGYKSDA